MQVLEFTAITVTESHEGADLGIYTYNESIDGVEFADYAGYDEIENNIPKLCATFTFELVGLGEDIAGYTIAADVELEARNGVFVVTHAENFRIVRTKQENDNLLATLLGV